MATMADELTEEDVVVTPLHMESVSLSDSAEFESTAKRAREEGDGRRRGFSRKQLAAAAFAIGALAAVCVVGLVASRRDEPDPEPALGDPEDDAGPRAPPPLDVMRARAFGTCAAQPPRALRWGASAETADAICCHNRRGAERAGYFAELAAFPSSLGEGETLSFFDTATGALLFVAPGPSRTYAQFYAESRAHGWPSFRDDEVASARVVVLDDGETVSVNGTHLGHNLPDAHGNRYCIDLVCVAGRATATAPPAVSPSAGPTTPPTGSSGAAPTGAVVLEDFGANAMAWVQTNDPVMGGQSDGTFSVSGGVGVLDGTVRDVPFLGAPGFIKAQADGAFPSVLGCDALAISARASSAYGGYRVSFGDAHGPDAGFYARGYKAGPIAFAVGDAFATVTIPFANFSDDWDDATGDIIVTCAEDASLCPDDATLADMGQLAIWAEGVNGDVHLEIDQIWAAGC